MSVYKQMGVTGGGLGDKKKRSPVDDYSTHPETTLALLEREKFPQRLWEPAAGRGRMVKVLRDWGYDPVIATDVQRGIDFLTTDRPRHVRSIVTNPPFRLANQFIERCMDLRVKKFALFGRIHLLESKGRYPLFMRLRPRRVWVFSNRAKVNYDSEFRERRGMMFFAWFVWERDYAGPTELDWIGP